MTGKIVYLSGGVGGAKLALGLDRILPPGQLSIIANTGDDFDHLGLRICPDIDTLVYTLSGEANVTQGWGRKGETGNFMSALNQLGGENWFFLGDLDLAMHVERTRMLTAGRSLTDVTETLAGRMGVRSRILPMCDQPAPTIVHTADGPLAFQHYFVRDRAEPVVQRLELLANRHGARPEIAPGVVQALQSPDLAAIIIGPSNPYISIDPILTLPGMKALIRGADVPCIAVSPIIGGQAVKGPTAKMMKEFGYQPGNRTVLEHYNDVISHLVIDNADRAELPELLSGDINIISAQTMMVSEADKMQLAKDILASIGNYSK